MIWQPFYAEAHPTANPSRSYDVLMLLKERMKGLQYNNLDLIQQLARTSALTLPNSVNIGIYKTKMPDPPDQRLSDEIRKLTKTFPSSVQNLILQKFSSVRVGGLYNIEGSRDREVWIIFSYYRQVSNEIPTPRIFEPAVCTKDWTQSTLAIVNRQLVALSVQILPRPIYPSKPTHGAGVRVLLQSWIGSKWDDIAILN